MNMNKIGKVQHEHFFFQLFIHSWVGTCLTPLQLADLRSQTLTRLTKYWLKGEKAGTTENFAILAGFPDNVRTTENGDFWVAIHCRRGLYSHFLSLFPSIRKLLLKLPITAWMHFKMHIGGKPHGVIAKYNADGQLIQILEDREGKVVRACSEVEEKDGKLWIGSVLMPFIAVYDLQWGMSFVGFYLFLMSFVHDG